MPISSKTEFPIEAIDTFLDGQPCELSLYVLCFSFALMNNLQLDLNIPGAEHIFVPFTTLYISFRTDASKLHRQLLAVALKIFKTVREEFLAIRLNVT